MIVHEKVYDVTSFVPRHPGGNMIWVKAGGDCTQLFDSRTTPCEAQATLDKYYIGELERVPGDEDKIITYNDDMKKGKFYMDCKVAVERWFKDNKKDPRVHPEMYIKSFVILAGVAVCHYCSFFLTTFLVSAVFAALHDVEGGGRRLHPARRQPRRVRQVPHLPARDAAYPRRRGGEPVHVAPAACGGTSRCTPTWTASTRIFGGATSLKDIRRVNEHQPHEAYHPLQHIYLALHLRRAALSFKSCFADDFNAYFSGRMGWVKVAKFTWGEALAALGSKAAWAFYYLYPPAKYSVHDKYTICALITITEFITGGCWRSCSRWRTWWASDSSSWTRRAA